MFGLCSPAFYQLIVSGIFSFISFISAIYNSGLTWGIISGIGTAVSLGIGLAINQFFCYMGIPILSWLSFIMTCIMAFIYVIILILYATGFIKPTKTEGFTIGEVYQENFM